MGSGVSVHPADAPATKVVSSGSALSAPPLTEQDLLANSGVKLALAQASAHIPHGGPICTALTLLYGLWSAAKSRQRWTAHFMCYLQAVEDELSTAHEAANHAGHMQTLADHLSSVACELESILQRNSFLAALFAKQDAAWLEQERERIEQMKQLCTGALIGDIAEDLDQAKRLARGMAQPYPHHPRQHQQHPDARADDHIAIRIGSPVAAEKPSMLDRIRSVVSPFADKIRSPTAAAAATVVAPPAQSDVDPTKVPTSFKLLRGGTLQVALSEFESRASSIDALKSILPVVDKLQALYAMWTAARTKTHWLAEFMVRLKALEIQVLQGKAYFRDDQYLAPIAATLQTMQSKVAPIMQRSRLMSCIHSVGDRALLDSLLAQLVAHEKKAMFTQMTTLAGSVGELAEEVAAIRARIQAEDAAQEKIAAEAAMRAQEEDLLARALHPIDQWAEIEATQRKYCLGTRATLMRQVADWIAPAKKSTSPPHVSSRLFLVLGDPGIGKSVLAATLLSAFPTLILGAHFFKAGESEARRSATRAIKNLAWQLTRQVAEYRSVLLDTLPVVSGLLAQASAAELWDILLAQPLAQIDVAGKPPSDGLDPDSPDGAPVEREKVVLLINGLDECATLGASGANPILQLLASQLAKLPPWLHVLATARDEEVVKKSLLAKCIHVELECVQKENEEDVALYLRKELERVCAVKPDGAAATEPATQQILSASVDHLSQKAQGMFLYASLLVETIERRLELADQPQQGDDDSASRLRSLARMNFDALPAGLDAFYVEQMHDALAAAGAPAYARRHHWLADWKSHELPGVAPLPSIGVGGSSSASSGVVVGPTFLRHALEVLLASFEPLSIENLAHILGVPSPVELVAALEPIIKSALFDKEERAEVDGKKKARLEADRRALSFAEREARVIAAEEYSTSYTVVVPFHKSARDWLLSATRLEVDREEDERACFVDGPRGHARLREVCWQALVVAKPDPVARVATAKQLWAGVGKSTALLANAKSTMARVVQMKLWPSDIPHLRMDAMAHPDVCLLQSDLVSYALRFGVRHCLQSHVATADAAILGSPSFQSRYPFLAAAQFLTHIQYLHARAAQGCLAGLALEYADAETSAMEWERTLSTPTTMKPRSAAHPAGSSTSATRELPSASLWLADPGRASSALHSFRSFVHLEAGEFLGSGQLWELPDEDQRRREEEREKKRRRAQRGMAAGGRRGASAMWMLVDSDEEDDELEERAAGHRSAPVTSYSLALPSLVRLRTAAIASQFIYSSAGTFPSGSPVELLGVKPFMPWFLDWHGRRVRKVEWRNKPSALPNLLATLVHQAKSNPDAAGVETTAVQVRIHGLAFSPDSLKIATLCSLDRNIRIFHAVSFELMRLIPPPVTSQDEVAANPTNLVWMADSMRIAVGGYRAPLRIFHTETGDLVGSSLGEQTRGVQCARFAADDAFALVVGYGESIELYHIASDTHLRSFGGGIGVSPGPMMPPVAHYNRVCLLEVNCRGNLIATGGWDEFVIIWSIGSKETQAAAVASDKTPAWKDSIRPIGLLLPPISSGFTVAASLVAAQPLRTNSIAWHPTLPNVLVTASTDAHGNGVCLWDIGSASLDGEATLFRPSPLQSILQKPEQLVEEPMLVQFTPLGDQLFVASKGSTTLSVFAVRHTAAAAEEVASAPDTTSVDYEFLGVCDVGDVGSDITSMSFCRIARAKTPGDESDEAMPEEFLLTGDSDGHARVWNVAMLLAQTHQEMAVATPRAARETDAEEVEDELAIDRATEQALSVAFPRIAPRGVVVNEKYIVLADLRANLCVYSMRSCRYVRTLSHTLHPRFVDHGASHAPDGSASIGAMVLGSSTNGNDPAVLVTAYVDSRAVKVWDIAHGLLLRVIGQSFLHTSTTCLALNPLPLAFRAASTHANQVGGTRAQVDKHGFSRTIQIMVHDETQLMLLTTPLFQTDRPLQRIVFQGVPKVSAHARRSGRRDRQDGSGMTQHAASVTAFAFHPTSLRAASVDGEGVVKMWLAFEPSAMEVQQNLSLQGTTVEWDRRARLQWSMRIRHASVDSEEKANRAIPLRCCAFNPSGTLLAVGGQHHCLTLFDVSTASTAVATAASSSVVVDADDPRTPRIFWRLAASTGDSLALAWHPSGAFLATVDRRHTITVWHVSERRMVRQYLNQPIASSPVGTYESNASTSVYLAFPTARQMVFHHTRENCVKVWTIDWMDDQATPGPSGPASRLLPPVLFHCERMSSSAQGTLIHLLSHD